MIAGFILAIFLSFPNIANDFDPLFDRVECNEQNICEIIKPEPKIYIVGEDYE